MNICERCKETMKSNGIYATFTYSFLDTIKTWQLCKNCSERTAQWIQSYENKFYAKEEECPRCGENNGGYAQGLCKCGLMNK